MPVFGNNMASGIARGIKGFFKREGSPTRDATTEPEQKPEAQKPDATTDQVAELRRMLESKDREIARLKMMLPASDAGAQGGIYPENIVWMFGTGRTGSNWLGRMMGSLQRHVVWQEPRVGALLDFYYNEPGHHSSKHFILGSPHREAWLRSIRSLVLEGANARFPEVAEQEGYVAIREPTGSAGAPLLMDALPESRMILLVRDPRDVVASVLDGSRKGGWLYERSPKNSGKRQYALANDRPDAFVEKRANLYLLQVGRAKQAYNAHEGRKVLVRYEDLRVATLETMKRIYSALEIPIDEGNLARAVKKHAWENVPEKKKGEGKFHRKATPQGWREDLTPKQTEIVERITAPLLDEFYPA